jgi:WD40 repeat protein
MNHLSNNPSPVLGTPFSRAFVFDCQPHFSSEAIGTGHPAARCSALDASGGAVLCIKIAHSVSRSAQELCEQCCVVVTGSDDRCVRVWRGDSSSSSSSSDWQLLHILRVHDGRVWAVDAIFAPCADSTSGGVLLASSGEDGRCCIWGETGSTLLWSEVITGDVRGLQFCAEGRQVFVSCEDSTVRQVSTARSILCFVSFSIFCQAFDCSSLKG